MVRHVGQAADFDRAAQTSRAAGCFELARVYSELALARATGRGATFRGLEEYHVHSLDAVRPMVYLDMSTVQARRTTKPPHNRSRSGYGSKVPTAYQLQIDKRWHRVYSVIWSNSGTCYIVKGGQRLYIATGEL